MGRFDDSGALVVARCELRVMSTSMQRMMRTAARFITYIVRNGGDALPTSMDHNCKTKETSANV